MCGSCQRFQVLVGARGAEVDAFLERVELLLVLPLAVVHFLRGAAAAVQRDPQAAAARRLCRRMS